MKFLHDLKVNLATKLLSIIDPDTEKIIGEKVASELDEKRQEWEVALLSIQSEIAEEFEGGLLHKVPTVSALCQKIRSMRRQWRVYKLKVERVADALQVDIPEVVEETKELVKENDDLREVVDTAKPALKHAASAVAQLEKIEEKQEVERTK